MDDRLTMRQSDDCEQPMPHPTILESVQRFWFAIVIATVIGAGIGVAWGLAADEEFSAEAQLTVGRIDVQTQSIPGFTTAAVTLADTYSRAIVADRVVAAIAKKTGLSRDQVLDDVSAAPIPETGTVRVFADAPTSAKAISVANASADALVTYVRSLNRFNPDSRRLLQQYQDASQELGKARAKVAEDGKSPEALAEVQRAQLRVNTIGGLYQSSQAGQASPNTLQPLAPAADADGDRSSNVQRAALVGAVVGLLLGCLLTLLLERRYPLRRD